MEAAASGHGRFGSLVATGPVEVRRDLSGLEALDGLGSGFWAVVAEFEGSVTAVRFAHVTRQPPKARTVPWVPLRGEWGTSLDEAGYLAGVREIRDRIAAGTVYQVNLCRVMSYELAEEADLDGLAQLLARGNPAPFLVKEGHPVTSREWSGVAPRQRAGALKAYREWSGAR